MKQYDYDRIWREVYGDLQKYGPVHRHMKRLYRKLLAPLEYETALDVGCGDGSNLFMLSEGRDLKRLAGIDISEESLKKSRSLINADFFVADIEKEAIADVFDLVICTFLLEHVNDDDNAIRNLSKMCGKYLLVSTIQGNYDAYRAWEETVGHVRNYAQGELQEKLQENGFSIIKAIPWGFPFYSPVVRRLQELNPSVGVGEYTFKTRLIAQCLNLAYYFNSFTKGDILVVLAEKK